MCDQDGATPVPQLLASLICQSGTLTPSDSLGCIIKITKIQDTGPQGDSSISVCSKYKYIKLNRICVKMLPHWCYFFSWLCLPFQIVPLLSPHALSMILLNPRSSFYHGNDPVSDFRLALTLHRCRGSQCTSTQGGSGGGDPGLSDSSSPTAFGQPGPGMNAFVCGAPLWTPCVLPRTHPDHQPKAAPTSIGNSTSLCCW